MSHSFNALLFHFRRNFSNRAGNYYVGWSKYGSFKRFSESMLPTVFKFFFKFFWKLTFIFTNRVLSSGIYIPYHFVFLPSLLWIKLDSSPYFIIYILISPCSYVIDHINFKETLYFVIREMRISGFWSSFISSQVSLVCSENQCPPHL